MLFAKDVMDVQLDVLVRVKQVVSLFVKVVQTNVKTVLAVQLVMVVKIIQLVLDVIPHVRAVLVVIRVVLEVVKLDVQAHAKQDVQVIYAMVVLAVIAALDAQVVLVA